MLLNSVLPLFSVDQLADSSISVSKSFSSEESNDRAASNLKGSSERAAD